MLCVAVTFSYEGELMILILVWIHMQTHK